MDTASKESLAKLTELLQSAECVDLIVDWQTKMTSLKAMGPESGGNGENTKAAWIQETLDEFKLSTHLVPAYDLRVTSGLRPNLITKIKGQTSKTLWLFGHMDVVGAGDLAAWQHDPFTVQRNGDWLTGRGVEDNQQAIVSMLLLAWAISRCQLTPNLNLGLAFMADEENGSRFGLEHLLKKVPEYFKPEDIYIVPDSGSPDASKIEVAEKGQLWLKIDVIGHQCHASTPNKGENAFLAAAKLVTHLDQNLPKLFPEKNDLFDPNISTVVPTKHLANVEAINIVPGREVFYLDCRLVPEVSPKQALEMISNLLQEHAQKLGVGLKIELVHMAEASSMDLHHPIIPKLKQAINQVYGVEAKLVGIGVGTVAALLRNIGLPALVWACVENTCHTPNERSSISATIKDSLVFAHLLFDD